MTLVGPGWRIATDPDNKGREEKWFDAPRADAKTTPVPWVIQNIFPNYHGVAWYWRGFTATRNPHPGGRYLLQFAAVNYLAEVWLNGKRVGGHEGGETPFTLDVTDAVRTGGENLLAVRVLNPSETRRIDGFILKETPSGFKHDGIACNVLCNSGGIVGPVELRVAPAIRIADLHVLPDWKTGEIRIRATLSSAAGPSETIAQFSAAPIAGGLALATTRCNVRVEAGATVVDAALRVPDYRLWTLDDPALYRVTAGIWVAKSPSIDRMSVRCGFRDFRFENGYYRLNGKRIFLKGTFYLVQFPIAYVLPHDPELVRRDLRNIKKAGYNLVRTAFRSMPEMLERCDEAGVLVYQEHYGSWQLEDSPNMKSRWNASISEVIRRDRNHPSLVLWGLLNETKGDDQVLKHAVTCLPMIRELDPTRIVQLNSGRYNYDRHSQIGGFSNPGSVLWESLASERGGHPCLSLLPVAAVGDRWCSAQTGKNGRPAFVSEYGQCGTLDLPSELSQFKRLGQEQNDDARYYRMLMDGFMADWRRWRLDEIWKRPGEFFTKGHRSYARLREPGETALRSNPVLVAYSSTHMVFDGMYGGCGLTTLFREPKDPLLFDVARLANAPLRWCLFATPNNVYRGSRVRFEAVLANEDKLRPGAYPGRVEVLGPDRRPVAAREIQIRLEDSEGGRERPFATPCFDEIIPLDGPAGAYEFSVAMAGHKEIPGGRLTLYADDPGRMPAIPREVTLWGEDAALAAWLSGHG